MTPREFEATVDERFQVTLPDGLVQHFHTRTGEHRPFDRLLITVDDRTGTVSVRPLYRSYAGIFAGLYGDTAEEVQAYIDGERASWEEQVAADA